MVLVNSLCHLQFVVTFGLDIKTPFECVGAHRYEQQLLFWLVTPLVLALSIFAIGLLKNCIKPSKTAESTSAAVLAWALPLVFKLMVRTGFSIAFP